MFNSFIELTCYSAGHEGSSPRLINVLALSSVEKDTNTGLAVLHFNTGTQSVATTHPYEEVTEHIRQAEQF